MALQGDTRLAKLHNLTEDCKDDEIRQVFYPLLLPGKALPEFPGPYNPLGGL